MNSKPLLITSPVNIRYLTGFVGAAPEEHEAYVLLTRNKLFLFTNSLYIERAKQLNQGICPMSNDKCPIKVVQISRDKPLPKILAEILTRENITELEFEENHLTVSEFNELTKTLKHIRLIPISDRIEKRRRFKKGHEVEAIKKAASMTDQCFSELVKMIKIGITETELAWRIESFFRNNGAGSSFSPIVAFGSHASQPHYIPANHSKLTTNSQILLDFGAEVDGYKSDMTRVVYFGTSMPSALQSAYSAVLSANEKALDHLKINSPKEFSGAFLDTLAKDEITHAGLPPYSHSLGHSVGLAIHESPRLTIKKDEVISPGMVFTIEPGVYIEGQFGIRIEDLVYLSDNGIEILSQSDKKLLVIQP